MNLAQRRALAAYQSDVLPRLMAHLHEAAGKPIEVEVHWDKIMKDDDAGRYGEPWYWTDVYFTPMILALQALRVDALGKEAVASGLNKIVFTYHADTAPISEYVNGLDLKDGVLTVNFEPGVNASDSQVRSNAIVRYLETKL